ncbi:MAG: DUF447 domain-containing protein [Thermoplasmatota archaeon]
MTYYEGILISFNKTLNTSAVGAEVSENHLQLRLYHPSDTSKNLGIGSKFTFSLTKSLQLFYKASLTGYNEPNQSELSEDEVLKKDSYYYPKEATKTFFCEVKSIEEKKGIDKYGKLLLKSINAEIKYQKGEKKEYLTRDNPYLNSMVYASRIPVAEKEQKEEIKNKVIKMLKNEDTELAKKIISSVEGERT